MSARYNTSIKVKPCGELRMERSRLFLCWACSPACHKLSQRAVCAPLVVAVAVVPVLAKPSALL